MAAMLLDNIFNKNFITKTAYYPKIYYHTPYQETTISVAGYAVAQLVEALHYKPEGRGFDSRWCHWNFSLT
jgi:hypothetical protein